MSSAAMAGPHGIMAMLSGFTNVIGHGHQESANARIKKLAS
jgi:hypothetical protein